MRSSSTFQTICYLFQTICSDKILCIPTSLLIELNTATHWYILPAKVLKDFQTKLYLTPRGNLTMLNTLLTSIFPYVFLSIYLFWKLSANKKYNMWFQGEHDIASGIAKVMIC